MKKLLIFQSVWLFVSVIFAVPCYAGGTEDAKAAWAALERGNNDQAIELCTRAINSGRLSSRVTSICYFTRGYAWANKGQFDRAISEYNRAIEHDATLPPIYYMRGNAWYEKGQYDKAISDYNKTVELDPEYANIHIRRGNAWDNKGQYDAAIADFTKAIEINPKDTLAYYYRANAWKNKEKFGKAASDYSKFIESNPKHASAYYRRGGVRGAIGDNIRAIEDYTKNIELKPENGAAYSLRGYLRGILGQYEQAEKDHIKALELVSLSRWKNYRPWALQHYADLWRRQGNFDKALDFCKEAISAGDYSTVYFRRAWIYLDMGNHDMARGDFKKFQELMTREGKTLGKDFWPDERETLRRMQNLFQDTMKGRP